MSGSSRRHIWFLHTRGTVRLEDEVRLAVLWGARGLGAFALGVFFILASQRGVPRSVLQEQWEPTVQFAALGIVAAGYGIAWRWEGVGGAIILVGSVLLGILATLAFEPRVALFGCLAFFAPGALFILYWQHHHRPVTLAAVISSMLALLVVGGVAAGQVYDHYAGPTHPNSKAERIPVDLAEWVWAGAVTVDGFTVKARLADPAEAAVELLVAPDNGDGGVRVVGAQAGPSPEGDVVTFRADGLRPGTRYSYTLRRGTHADEGRRGEVSTLPSGPSSFTLAFSSCARIGSNGEVFDRIREADPLLYLITGDFHYQNISANDPGAIRSAYDRSLATPGQQALYLGAPIVYTWDDHDFGGDGSDRTTPAREAVQAVYRDYVPHYDLPAGAGAGPIYQAFTVGGVRFIVTDGRSERDPAGEPDGAGKSMLGQAQKEWFKAEVLAARESAALIVWVNSVPWIAQPAPGADHWGAYATERRELSDFLMANGIDNLVMLSGDAHMLAADDGSNNTYATDGSGPGFPVFHAAALDRPGGVKGGPYSEGAFPGGGQFGLLTITDVGELEVTVAFSGRNWEGTEVVGYSFTTPRRGPG